MAATSAFPGGLHVGGGINTDNATDYLDAGASHVIVTSFVFRDGMLDEQRLQDLVGSLAINPPCYYLPTFAVVLVIAPSLSPLFVVSH